MRSCLTAVLLFLLSMSVSFAADSVDVVFRYNTTGHSGVSVPGQFNGWSSTAWPMTFSGGDLYLRTARLQAGTYQYKFYYSGVSQWPNDPLNHHIYTDANNNSILSVKDPTIYHFLPNQRSPIVGTVSPTISAYLYPKVGGAVDTATLTVRIDGTLYSNLGNSYNAASKQFTFVAPPLLNGNHTAILSAGTNADTVTFTVQAGFVRLLNQFPFSTWKSEWMLYGAVDDSSVASVGVVRNSVDTFAVAVSNKSFSFSAPLVDGLNSFVAVCDSSGSVTVSSPVSFTRKVRHSPNALISFEQGGLPRPVTMHANYSDDPDSGQSVLLTYYWTEDSTNPYLFNINGSTVSSMELNPPAKPGEYYFNLVAQDPDGNEDTTRNYFTVHPAYSDYWVTIPALADNPDWVKQGRMYLLFFKSATPEGTINAAMPMLDYIKAMGYNIIWIMPVMKNAYPINNGPGPGYNISEFYDIAPEYGTKADFKNFTKRAHELGLKIILDVTPNHTSSNHPFANHVRSFKQNSPYWGFYQHDLITNPNYHPNISESKTSDNVFVFYSAFSDALLNYNWADADARNYMIDVYKYWITEMGVDGYRLDVYWGPHARTNNGDGGESEMGIPLRTALKHVKPDILLLAETAGTGVGSEVNYADQGGGVDAAYDWGLFFNSVQNFYVGGPQIASINSSILNYGTTSMGFIPGFHSSFLRFLENQDEDRIAYQYGSYIKTMPVSTIVEMSVGLPLVYSGQEVGWGLGISDYDQRRRGVINWNYPGKALLQPHYQKLAQIRKQFSPFWSQEQIRTQTGNSWVLGYTRPWTDLNGIIAVNFDDVPHLATILLFATGSTPNVSFSGFQNGKTYYASDLYNDTVYSVVFTAGSAPLPFNIPAYGSAVLVLAESSYALNLPPLTAIRETGPSMPDEFFLSQNYPNPFNPSTTIEFSVPKSGLVSLKIFDILGREVASLVNQTMQPGNYTVDWDARNVASGLYFYRLSASSFYAVKKMMLIR